MSLTWSPCRYGLQPVGSMFREYDSSVIFVMWGGALQCGTLTGFSQTVSKIFFQKRDIRGYKAFGKKFKIVEK